MSPWDFQLDSHLQWYIALVFSFLCLRFILPVYLAIYFSRNCWWRKINKRLLRMFCLILALTSAVHHVFLLAWHFSRLRYSHWSTWQLLFSPYNKQRARVTGWKQFPVNKAPCFKTSPSNAKPFNNGRIRCCPRLIAPYSHCLFTLLVKMTSTKEQDLATRSLQTKLSLFC